MIRIIQNQSDRFWSILNDQQRTEFLINQYRFCHKIFWRKELALYNIKYKAKVNKNLLNCWLSLITVFKELDVECPGSWWIVTGLVCLKNCREGFEVDLEWPENVPKGLWSCPEIALKCEMDRGSVGSRRPKTLSLTLDLLLKMEI